MEYDYIITKPELNEDTLAHYGVPGMKWGVRKRTYGSVNPKLAKNKQTKKVANDYHSLSNSDFRNKYKTSRHKFKKRYIKSEGDTYSMGLKKAKRVKNLTGNKVVAKMYDINEKYYTKTGNKVLADANRRAKENALKTIEEKKKKMDRHERAANASAKDAADLRKHGYVKEAAAVQEVSDKQRAKSKTAKKKNYK